ncbi:MAG: flavoprotein [Actinomycetota bacterium]
MPSARSPVVYLVACGAGPIVDLPDLLTLGREAGWTTCVSATAAGEELLDAARVAPLCDYPLRLSYDKPSPLWPPAELLVVAPATFNTVNKLAAGIADSIGLSLVAECLGLDVPAVLAPSVNPALARHPRYRSSLNQLEAWGVTVLRPSLVDLSVDLPVWMAPWANVVRAGDTLLRP